MTSIMQPQSQADIDHTNQIIRDYLSNDAGYESDEAIASDDEVMHDDDSHDAAAMAVDALDDDDDDDEAAGEDKWAVLEKKFSGQAGYGAEWWEKQSPAVLAPLFFQLRNKIYQLELKAQRHNGRQPRWGPATGETEGEEDATDDTGDHLARWLGGLTQADLLKAKTQDIIWWLVDMCHVLDSMEVFRSLQTWTGDY